MQFRSCTPKIHKNFKSSMAFRSKNGAIYRPEMPQAQRRGISSILTSSSRQTAAHRHPLWTYRMPHPVRQGLI